jgi:D-alanyl-D-alanine carboxypeptidase
MARIVEEAMKNPDFRDLFCATSYDVPATERSDKRELKSLNYLIEQTIVPKYNYKGATGGIAHYTEYSGASLVCTAEEKGMSYIVVVMGCERKANAEKSWVIEYYGNYEETWELLDYAFDKYKICRLLHEGQSMAQFPVAGGENHVVAQTHTSKDAILPVSAKLDNLILKYSVVGGGLSAPLEKDQNIANLQIWYRTSCIVEAELYAMSPVRALADLDMDIQGAASRDDSNLSQFLSFVGIVCLVIMVPLALYLVVNHARRLIARSRRRRRRMGRRRSR